MIREELLALADELDGMDCREGYRTCPANGTKDCRGDLSCEEAVARASARRIREIAEHDACEEAATTVSAYDLLPDEDRKDIAWVREHGGLDAVEKRLMPEGMEWPRYTDGSAVEIGDEVVGPDYGERIHVDAIKFHANGFTLCDKSGFDKWYESDDRFERHVADTWERLEEDAGKNPFDYCKDVGHRLDTCENSEAYKARDLVRRARALAERGEI